MNAAHPQASLLRGVDARPDASARPLLLAPVEDHATLGDLAGGRWSAEAGLLRLHDPAAPLGGTRHWAAGRRDPRAPRRRDWTRHDRLPPRGWPRAAGAAEANAAHPRRPAPSGTGRRGRWPARGPPGASQPPRSRCAKRVARPARSRRARGLVEPWSASDARGPRRLGRAGDAPADPAPGAPAPLREAGSASASGVLPRHGDAGRAGRRRPPLGQAQRGPGPPRLAVWQRLGPPLRPAGPAPRRGGRGARPWASPAVRPGSEAPAPRQAVTGWTRPHVWPPRAHAVVAPAPRASERDGGTGRRCHAPRAQAGTGSPPRRGGSPGEWPPLT
jgi:hypothetical protein